MWLLYTFIGAITMALVNYIDEYLTSKSSIEGAENIHVKIGGILLISCLLGILSVVALSFVISDFSMSTVGLSITFFTSILSVGMFASYFYLFQLFPANQVVPLFGLSSLWLLVIELFVGGSLTGVAVLGVLIIAYGSYILDTSTFKWKIPSKLLVYMIGTTLLWALILFLIKGVSQYEDITTIFFYQYIGIFVLGILLFFGVKNYRVGLIDRIKKQGSLFLGMSLLNEGVAQISFFAYMLAVSLAPFATYVSAVGSVQYIFLLFFLLFFPITKRNKITKLQCIAIAMITIGVFLIEIFK